MGTNTDKRTAQLLVGTNAAIAAEVRDELQRIASGEGPGFSAVGRDSWRLCRDLGLLARNRNGNTYVTRRGRGVLVELGGVL